MRKLRNEGTPAMIGKKALFHDGPAAARASREQRRHGLIVRKCWRARTVLRLLPQRQLRPRLRTQPLRRPRPTAVRLRVQALLARDTDGPPGASDCGEAATVHLAARCASQAVERLCGGAGVQRDNEAARAAQDGEGRGIAQHGLLAAR